MHSTLKNDLEILPSLLETAKQQGLNYLNEIDTRATSV
jgi:hypothetical protein